MLPVISTVESRRIPVLLPGPETAKVMKKAKFAVAPIASIPAQADRGGGIENRRTTQLSDDREEGHSRFGELSEDVEPT